MSRTPAAVLACLEAELFARRWHEPPQLYFLTMRRHGPGLRPARLLPASTWAGRPAEALEELAASSARWAPLLQAAAPPELYGLAFRCEVWEVQSEPDTPAEERRRIHADAVGHRLHARPDRIELRSFNAVDRAGITYMVSRRRDTGQVHSHAFTDRTTLEEQVLGVVPDALDTLVRAILGVQLAPRPDEPEWVP